MKRSTLILAILALAVILPTSAWSWAEKEPANPLRAEAKQLLEKSSELSKRGELDAARELLSQARALLDQANEQENRPQPRQAAGPHRGEQFDRLRAELERAESRGDEQQLERLRAELHRMAEVGRHEHHAQAAAPPRRPAPHHPPHHPPHGGPHPELEKRLHHLHAAVEHLRQAGMPELAEQAMREMEETRERLAQAHRQNANVPLREMHQQLERLSDEVRELRELIIRIAREQEDDDED